MITDILRLFQGRLARNALSLYAVQGLNVVMPLILLPYLLRTLNPEVYGSIVFAQAVIGYAIMLTDFGFNLTAARDISVVRDQPGEIAKIYWTTMAAKAVLTLVSLLLLAAAVTAIPRCRAQWDVFAACGLLLIGSALFPGWYFQGLERLRDVAIVQAVSKCVITAAIFLSVKSPHDKLPAALLMSSPQLAGMAIACLLRIRAVPFTFHRPTMAEVASALRGSADMFFASASTSLYLYTNTFVLGLMSGEQAVAYYSVGNRLVIAVQSLTSPVTQAIFPRASLLFSSNPDRAWRLVKRVSWLLFPLMAAASLLMVIFAPFIVGLFGGADYARAVPVMRIMAPVPLLVTAAALFAQTVMVNIGLTRYLWRIYITVGIINVLTLPPLVHFFSAAGAAVSLTISELIGPVLMFWLLRSRGLLRPRAGGMASNIYAGN